MPDIGNLPVNAKNGKTFKIGLIGRGIQLSRTPFMHEAEGRRLGLDYKYNLIDIEKMGEDPPTISEILSSLEKRGFDGVNVTFPYKQSVMEFIDEFSDAALAVGSVNTVLFSNGKRIGHNTDVTGFEQSYRQNMGDRPQSNVLLLGAGGAGVSVAHALIKCGVKKLHICDIDESAGHQLVMRLNSRFGDQATFQPVEALSQISGSLDGVVNATPMGMAKIPGCPFPMDLITKELWFIDIIYFPLETELLKAARERGCHTVSGSGMAVFQALHAFEIFTSIQADDSAMAASFNEFKD